MGIEQAMHSAAELCAVAEVPQAIPSEFPVSPEKGEPGPRHPSSSLASEGR